VTGATLQFRLNSADHARLSRVQAYLGHRSEADTYLHCMRMIDEIVERVGDLSAIDGRQGLETSTNIRGNHGREKCQLDGLANA